jgi:hypothetical protein
MRTIIGIIMLFCLTCSATAQISPFLQKGQSGFGINAGTEKGSGFNGLFAEIGTSVGGVLDIEAGYYHIQFDQDELYLLDDDANAKYYGLALTWWFLRSQPSSLMDFNLGMRPSFELSDYSHFRYPTPDGSDVIEYKEFYNAAIGLASNIVFHLSGNWQVQPFYNIKYEVGDEKESLSQTSDTNFEKGVVSTFGIILAKQFQKKNSLYLSLKQHSNTYGIGDYYDVAVGYVFPW